MRRSARLAYCFLFTLAMVLAWVLRDFAKPLIEKLPCTYPNYFLQRALVGCVREGGRELALVLPAFDLSACL